MNEEHLEFDVIREDFNLYKIENGQLLKAKHVVTDITIKSSLHNKQMVNLTLKDISHIITNVKIDTTGFQISSSDKVTEKDQLHELKFRAIKEVVNIYETDKALLFLASKIQKIFLTNKIDNTGAPILRYETSTGFSLLNKDTLVIRQPPPSSPILTTSELNIFSERYLCELCRQTGRELGNSRNQGEIYRALGIGAIDERGIPQVVDEIIHHLQLNSLIRIDGENVSLTSKGLDKCEECRS